MLRGFLAKPSSPGPGVEPIVVQDKPPQPAPPVVLDHEKHTVQKPIQKPTVPGNVNPNPDKPVDQVPSGPVETGLSQVHKFLAEGPTSPFTRGNLLGMVKDPEPEVRKEALEALQQLGDTNAIPELEEIARNIQDPREKVAVMDVIEYLKLPDFDEVAMELMSAAQADPSAAFPPSMNNPQGRQGSRSKKGPPRASHSLRVIPSTAPGSPGQP